MSALYVLHFTSIAMAQMPVVFALIVDCGAKNSPGYSDGPAYRRAGIVTGIRRGHHLRDVLAFLWALFSGASNNVWAKFSPPPPPANPNWPLNGKFTVCLPHLCLLCLGPLCSPSLPGG